MRIARWLMVAVLAVYWPGIALGTHLPQEQVFEVTHDKLAHIGSFSVLAFLLTWCVMYRRPSLWGTIAVLAIVLLYGMFDELTQRLVPTRNADLYDWFADVCGAVAGLVVYFVSVRLLRVVLPAGAAQWSATSRSVT